MPQPRACPAYWISLLPEQEEHVQYPSLDLVRWFCTYCDNWHAELRDLSQSNSRPQALICVYDGQPANGLALVIHHDLPGMIICWWRCENCRSWHLELI